MNHLLRLIFIQPISENVYKARLYTVNITECHAAGFPTVHIIKKYLFLTRELSLINTCCWRADHEILMHDGGAGVH